MHKSTTSVALITGASQGLGLEVARLFARRGMGLILTARSGELLERRAQELRHSSDVVALAGDVTDPMHAERLVRTGLAHFGHIDVLINNASNLGPTPMPELAVYPLEALMHVFRVNAIAPLHLSQLVLPQMKARGQGLIINVSSDAAVEAYPTWGGYGASKAALEHLSHVLAAELSGTGVRVYTVDPGDMNTQMHRDAEPGVDLSHLPSPEKQAPAFLWLLENERTEWGRFHAAEIPVPPMREVEHAGT